MSTLEPPRARYKQVASLLREAIRRGDYLPGSTLPSQPDLAREYGLNQSSISRAMAMLQSEGWVRTEHGRGSVVLEMPTVKRVRRIARDYRSGQSYSSYAEEMADTGLTPRTELVSWGAETFPEGIAEALELDPGTRGLVRKRHMFADDKPVQLATSYIPMDVAGSVDIAMPDTGPSGMYERLAERGFGPVRFTEDIEVRSATPDEASFLNTAQSQPVFCVLRTAFDANGRRVEACTNILAAFRWKLTYAWGQEP
ncbi:GntR family transcriptional regulator [Nocardiopsis ganjiahuensis]|uniref:GntR family transcriptional regulator n=1 Tax=Nocardiopsis ganjiahuensis TaxID=239984 RepID=UPI00036208AF|nr:GntR family transcriptional regulator [Nocardiopsis ganjiahuensis]